jgi:ubiquinone biosynthesis protein Coq4
MEDKADSIVYQGFDPEAFMDALNTDENWLGQRMAFSHDVYHVITGFDGSVLGEYGLAAFCFTEFRDSLNAFVLSCLPYVLIPNFKQTHKFIAAIIKGLILGLKSKPLVAYQFEANWDKPLSEVRQELGISEFFLA